MSDYKHYFVETYLNPGEPSSKGIRVRPLPGQGMSPNVNVECSSRMRSTHPVGTVFRLQCKLSAREGGPPFLYSSFHWPYQVVSREEATRVLGETRK